MNRDFKGIWIPKFIWLNKELSLQEKVFFIEIESLDNENGCYAGNEYFSEFFGVSKSRCTQVIKSLEKKGFISSSLTKKKGSISERVLKINSRLRKLNPTVEKTESHGLENSEYNNTSNNNTSIKDTMSEKINFETLLIYLNRETGRSFKVINKSVRNKFAARLRDGYSKEDIRLAIHNASQSKHHRESNSKYLTPEFFTRTTTLDMYGFSKKQKTEKEIVKEGGHRNF